MNFDIKSRSELYAKVFSAVGDVVVVIDRDRCVLCWNRAAEVLYGVNAEDILGHKLEEAYQFQWLDPNDEAAAWTALAQVGTWRGENIHILKDGRALHVESSVSALNDENGNPTAYLAVIRDVTERHRAEADLKS